MTERLDLLADLTSLLGAMFFLVSAVGLLRLPDFYTRVHAPTKAATLGISCLVASSALKSLARQDMVWIEDLLIILFLWMTMPISSQILLRVATVVGIRASAETRGRPS